jgi:Icc-related predicted phosphoesterase
LVVERFFLVHILAVSDITIPFIYSPQVRNKYGDIDFVISCGDLPYHYLEYIISSIDKPLYFVRGNHDPLEEYGAAGPRKCPHGGTDLHRRVIKRCGVLFAGVEGSLRYKRNGCFQYTQREMWRNVFTLLPGVFRNRFLYGRYLDVFVTHASPWDIHDKPDLPHQGIKAFRWFIHVFQPAYHFHGHVHVYRPDTVTETQFGLTKVLNAYGYRDLVLELSDQR